MFAGSFFAAGAMRLPCNPEDKKKIHFLPDYYAKQVFDLPLGQFRNSDTNAFYKFYNMERIQIKGKTYIHQAVTCMHGAIRTAPNKFRGLGHKLK